MCVVSNIGTGWQQTFPQQYPQTFSTILNGEVSRIEFDALRTQNATLRTEVDRLRADVAALRDLLKAAKIYDEATGQADCETDEKVALIKRIADLIGVDLEDVFD